MDEEELARRCRSVVEELRGLSGRWRRWPEDLKAEVIEHAAACRARGESESAIAKRLGIWQTTLARWRRDRECSTGCLRPVAIVPSRPDPRVSPRGAALQLTTPAGYRVEGLDPDTLAFLLRILG